MVLEIALGIVLGMILLNLLPYIIGGIGLVFWAAWVVISSPFHAKEPVFKYERKPID